MTSVAQKHASYGPYSNDTPKRGNEMQKQSKPVSSSTRSKLLKLPDIPMNPIQAVASQSTDEIMQTASIMNRGGGGGTDGGSTDGGGTDGGARAKPKNRNPFHVPTDVEVFTMREQDRRARQQEKEATKNLPIYEKNTTKRTNHKKLLAEDEDDIAFYNGLRKRDADKFLVNRQKRADRHFGKENLHDFIAKKREMFLVQYALGVKRDEMHKLESIAQAQEQKLLDDEKALEEDAAKFDAFLKENDKNSVEAIKKAETETRAKLEKIQEIKRLNVQMMGLRSDMSKNEDQLKDLLRYRVFLERLTPKEFLAQHGGGGGTVNGTDAPGDDSTNLHGDHQRQDTTNDTTIHTTSSTTTTATTAAATTDTKPVMYFNSPNQLLDLFAELEENNLALIQNCQETEETLEELKAKIAETTSRMESETVSLNQQIDFLNAAIAREEEKARMLEERAKMFTMGIVGAESQEKLLQDLNQKVKEVYRRCLLDSDTNLPTLQMLTSIENRLEHLFESIERMAPEKVEQAEKVKDKERRLRLREEKMEAQRIVQEERVQRALERARAPVTRKTGKVVMFRSAPSQKKKKAEEDGSKKKEEDDLEYYWN